MGETIKKFQEQGYIPETKLPWDWKLYLEDILANVLVYFQAGKAYDEKMIKKLEKALDKVRDD
jgi:hypothetical protein